MKNVESESTASDKVNKRLYEEIMRERCKVQGHAYWPVTIWGGTWQHITRRSYRQCDLPG